jgi:hypothetical protein
VPDTACGSPAWMIWLSISGMPTSPVIVSAISWLRAAMPSLRAWRNLARSSVEVWLQPSKAALAAATARSTSSGVPSGIDPMTSSVEALTTSMVPEPVEGTHWPSM